MVNLWLIMVNNWNNNISGWWFGTFGQFFRILGTIIPFDFHIFQRGRYTTNQLWFMVDISTLSMVIKLAHITGGSTTLF